MTLVRYQYILRLELSVDDSVVMQNPDSLHNLGDKVSYDFLVEFDLALLQVKVNIALAQVLHYYVNLVLILESFADCDQDVSIANFLDGFTLHQIDLFDFAFVDDFHRILFRRFFVLCKHDVTKSTSPKIFQGLITLRPVPPNCFFFAPFRLYVAIFVILFVEFV
jgi:hypothetical protein